MRVALLHPYFVNQRGGERLFYTLCQMYPEADIYALLADLNTQPEWLRSRHVSTTFAQRLPYSAKLFTQYFFLYPLAVEQIDLRSYDLIVSSSSAWMHGALAPAEAVHICYCHSPFRYAWSWYNEFIGGRSSHSPSRLVLSLLLHRIRTWDFAAAQRVDHFIANSHVTKRRIARYFRRDSTVIHPPVEVDRFRVGEGSGDYFLVASGLVKYKKVEAAIRAFNQLGLKLLVVGDGPERAALQKMAQPNVVFLGGVPDAQLSELYSGCKALIFTAEEDFGIVPVEAQAAGRPVIAYRRGGALETVREGETGLFFDEQTPDAIVDAIGRFDPSRFDRHAIRAHAKRFSREVFAQKLTEFVNSKLEDHKRHASAQLLSSRT